MLGLHYSREKDDVVTQKDYLGVHGTIMLEFNINDFIKESFVLVICFGFGWFDFNCVSKLFFKFVKVCETKSFFYLKLRDWLIY